MRLGCKGIDQVRVVDPGIVPFPIRGIHMHTQVAREGIVIELHLFDFVVDIKRHRIFGATLVELPGGVGVLVFEHIQFLVGSSNFHKSTVEIIQQQVVDSLDEVGIQDLVVFAGVFKDVVIEDHRRGGAPDRFCEEFFGRQFGQFQLLVAGREVAGVVMGQTGVHKIDKPILLAIVATGLLRFERNRNRIEFPGLQIGDNRFVEPGLGGDRATADLEQGQTGGYE